MRRPPGGTRKAIEIMAAAARPVEDRHFEAADGQAPLIRALVRGLIEHTSHGIVSLTSGRSTPTEEPR